MSRGSHFSLVAFLLNAFALSALVGVEFVINLVFNDLPDHTVDALREGSLGIALTVASIGFLLGTLAYVSSMYRTREVPTMPLVLYAFGAVPVSFRAMVPEAALDLGLVAIAVGVGWLGIWLFGRASTIPNNWADHDTSEVVLAGARRSGPRCPRARRGLDSACMDLYDVMRTTSAVREFTDDPLPDDVLHTILDNARFAPERRQPAGHADPRRTRPGRRGERWPS